ncbi:MAG: hypothetical protein WD942_07260 [Dehalococcoidia bacterium]
MQKIDVDREVLDFLKAHAEPFVDTPNDVLRRLLKISDVRARETGSTYMPAGPGEVDTSAFIDFLLAKEFGGGFHVRSPYRTMYEDDTRIVYFQNFNKAGTANLWYRVKGTALDTLRDAGKEAFIAFTNPAERLAYIVPLMDLEKRLTKARWSREDLEVNIDPAADRWRELDWDLSKHLRRYNQD